MNQKLRFWICFIVLTALCWIDYQFFSEGGAVTRIAPQKRQLAHLVILMLIIPIGYAAWAKHSVQWIKRFWLLSYSVALGIIVLLGGLQYLWQPFSVEFLDIVSSIRLFFTSPMPFLVLLLFSILIQREKFAEHTF